MRKKCIYCERFKDMAELTPAFNRTLEQLRGDKRKTLKKYRCKVSECWREPLYKNETKNSYKNERAMSLAATRSARSGDGINICCSTN